jgi:hypothetical protein
MKFRPITVAACLIATIGTHSARDALGRGTVLAPSEKSGSAAATSTGTVTASGGEIYFGGRRMARPFVLEYVGDALVVNGYKLRAPRDHPRRRGVTSCRDSLQYQLSLRAAKEIQRAYSEGLADGAVIERLARFYSTSELVKSVEADSIRLTVTYRDGPEWPERIILPSRGPNPPLSENERQVQRLERRKRELLTLRRTLEDGALIVILPTGRITLPRQEAESARAAIERYQRRGDSAGLAAFVPTNLWGYLREPVELEAAR